MSKLICMNPDENYHKECDRNDNRCCMCTKPRVPIKLDTLKELVKLLKTSGINSKQQVINKIEVLLEKVQE